MVFRGFLHTMVGYDHRSGTIRDKMGQWVRGELPELRKRAFGDREARKLKLSYFLGGNTWADGCHRLTRWELPNMVFQGRRIWKRQPRGKKNASREERSSEVEEEQQCLGMKGVKFEGRMRRGNGALVWLARIRTTMVE